MKARRNQRGMRRTGRDEDEEEKREFSRITKGT